jgi:membrane protein required for colicin V production
MGEMGLAPVDFVCLVILALAFVRGVMRGLLRETFSIASLAAACLMVMTFYGDAAEWLLRVTQGRVGEISAPWIGGALLGVITIGVITLFGRLVRRGAKFAGLGWADRTGGALLGTAEGVIVGAVIVSLLGYAIGREHPILLESHSLEALEDLEHFAQTGEIPEMDLPDIPLPEVKLPQVAAGPSEPQTE